MEDEAAEATPPDLRLMLASEQLRSVVGVSGGGGGGRGLDGATTGFW